MEAQWKLMEMCLMPTEGHTLKLRCKRSARDVDLSYFEILKKRNNKKTYCR